MSTSNPCLDCGACCAYFRVSFYWAESDVVPGGTVPDALTVKVNDHFLAMRGTQSKPARCVCLQGEVGQTVACGIYELRPSPCREVMAGDAQCHKARVAHGLPSVSDGVAHQ